MLLFLHAWLHFVYSMDEISNLNMFYRLANAQCIQDAVNIGTSAPHSFGGC